MTAKSIWPFAMKSMNSRRVVLSVAAALFLVSCAPPQMPSDADGHMYSIKISGHQISKATRRMRAFQSNIKNDNEDVISFYVTANEKVLPEGRRAVGAAIFDCVRPDNAFYTVDLDSVEEARNLYAVYFQTQLSVHSVIGDDGKLKKNSLNLDMLKRDGLCLALTRMGGGIVTSRAQLLRSNRLNLEEYLVHFKD